MVRASNSKSHNHVHPEEEEDDAEDVAAGTGTDTSSHREGKGAEQKPSNHRSKHSETEQRRRCKINERFQILRDLIPPNDQKRDKASLLLEVIEYIQFLQEKLQLYEGSYQQVWGQEPTKLIPWRANHGPVDHFAHNSAAMRNGSVDEHSEAQAMSNIQRAVEPELGREFAYNRGTEHPAGSPMPAVPLNIPLEPFAYPPGRSVPPTENLACQPPGSSAAECGIVNNEGRTFESGSSSSSDVYSQVLLKKLSQALETSGVDLSQANISVELDLGKGPSTAAASPAVLYPKAVADQPPSNPPQTQSGNASGQESFQAAKRLRTRES